ncbi:response regulator transcription factor [Aestuariirhabdus sp. Z084]|uniref:response regulator n=1 Tax=Aestuariirhabdus haliotis TaxID=2918751 RepID=UPI00201B3809|nr:response regulator transcription factor [Aestuariirhabdus haliotis]MCL6416205.1 response regulator transcription factor [Aestuariirhabdus haliotis]MCL6420257.1 response regulator transcription factor [Aestuariirhabdus haliotis]
MKLTILVADDHPLFRAALREALEEKHQQIHWLEASTFAECMAITDAEQEHIDLVLLDLNMPDNNGLMGLVQLRSTFPAIAVAIVSATDQPSTICKAMHNGALGYIPKASSLDCIRQAMQTMLSGQRWVPENIDLSSTSDTDHQAIGRLSTLTRQQLNVLGMIAKGMLNKQIAAELNIKETTVKTHISEIFDKLGIINRTQAAMFTQFLETPQ